jgi:hypothetical protein
MGTANKEYQVQLRQLAELMLAVSGESDDEAQRPGAGTEAEASG